MFNLMLFFIFLTVAVLVGCGSAEDSRPQHGTEIEETESAVVDSIISDLDRTSEELQSISEEVKKAIDDILVEDN
jgi:hypothetical protein